MTLTTNTSPITVIIVVEVVGVSPRGHTSGEPPVESVTSAIDASSLSGFPVMTINGQSGIKVVGERYEVDYLAGLA